VSVARNYRTTDFIPTTVPMRYLISDIHNWSQTSLCLYKKTCLDSRSSKLKSVYREMYPSIGGEYAATLSLPTAIKNVVKPLPSRFLSTSELEAAYSADVSAWTPCCSHWLVTTGFNGSCSVVKLSLGDLRRYWHKDHSSVRVRLRPPLVVPNRLLLRPFFWRLFWSLSLTNKAFTPWWRLLQDCIGYRSRLHRWNPNKFDTPFCQICLCSTAEDLFHFVVGCSLKWRFWSDVFSLVHLSADFPSKIDIWSGLVSLSSASCKPLDEKILLLLGSAFATLWRYHWRCVIDEEMWCSITAINMFKQDHHILVSSILNNSTDTPNSLDIIIDIA
jgi:hypothetical protein